MLESEWEAVLRWGASMLGFIDAVTQWFDTLVLKLAPLEPNASFLLLLAAVTVIGLLAWAVSRMFVHEDASHTAWPELLISNGQTQPPEDGVAMFTLSISNLNAYPVQLIELAVGAGVATNTEVAGINELLGSGRQLTLDVQLAGLGAHDALVDLYFYTTIGRSRSYRLQAKLQWQPYSETHKVVLLEQRIDTAHELASEQIERHRRQRWQKDRRRMKRFISPLAPAGLLSLSSTARSDQQSDNERLERHPEVSDFPADF